MAKSTRDTVMDALLARLKSKCGTLFQTYSRVFVTWEELLDQNNKISPPMPALYLYDGVGFGGGKDHKESKSLTLPGVVKMNRTIVVYARSTNAGTPGGRTPNIPGGTVLYPLYEAIEAALGSDDISMNLTDLGMPNVVVNVWIEGDIHFVTPDIDPTGQGMLVIPVLIMLRPTV